MPFVPQDESALQGTQQRPHVIPTIERIGRDLSYGE